MGPLLRALEGLSPAPLAIVFKGRFVGTETRGVLDVPGFCGRIETD